MTIISILLAVLIDKISALKQCKQYQWFSLYENVMLKLFPTVSQRYSLWQIIFSILPLLVVVLIIQLLLRHVFWGWAGFIFNFIVLVYCLGSSRLGDYVLHFIGKTTSQSDTSSTETPLSQTSQSSAEDFIVGIHEEVFAIIFWFIFFGAFGAFLYRLLLTLRKWSEEPTSIFAPYAHDLLLLLSILNWPSIRLLTLCLSLGGAFGKTFPVWWQGFLTNLDNNQYYLTHCTLAALEKPSDEKEIEHLFHRSMLIFFVILALMTLASWVS